MKKTSICGIYKITSPSNKVYIGESVDIEKRFKTYRSLNCKSQPLLFKSLVKHGWENHIFEIIEVCKRDELKCRERYWQDLHDVINKEKGLNLKLTQCGDAKVVHSEETKIKIGDAQKGEKNHMYGKFGELNPNYGKKGYLSPIFGIKRSQEVKDEISARFKEYYKTHPGNMTRRFGKKHPRFGKKITEEHKKLLSDFNKDRFNKIVVCQSTGIFYDSLRDASEAYNYSYKYLSRMLTGERRNKTSLTYV